MHDIGDGSTNNFYPAVKGYDLATGWGSFDGQVLLQALTGCPKNATCAPTIAPTNAPTTIDVPLIPGLSLAESIGVFVGAGVVLLAIAAWLIYCICRPANKIPVAQVVKSELVY